MNITEKKFLYLLAGALFLSAFSGCGTLNKQLEAGWGFRLPDDLTSPVPPPRIELPKKATEADANRIEAAQYQWGEAGWERVRAIRGVSQGNP